jgi:hypothetical protein
MNGNKFQPFHSFGSSPSLKLEDESRLVFLQQRGISIDVPRCFDRGKTFDDFDVFRSATQLTLFQNQHCLRDSVPLSSVITCLNRRLFVLDQSCLLPT